MKYVKDVPRKYRKYVRWGLFSKQGNRYGDLFANKAIAKKHQPQWGTAVGMSVQPVLCLPLSEITGRLYDAVMPLNEGDY